MSDIDALRAAQAKQAEIDRLQEQGDYRAVMGTPEGRRLIWGILARGRIFAATYTGNSETFYREGRREFCLEIFNAVLTACPELYTQAVMELQERSQPKPGDTNARAKK